MNWVDRDAKNSTVQQEGYSTLTRRKQYVFVCVGSGYVSIINHSSKDYTVHTCLYVFFVMYNIVEGGVSWRKKGFGDSTKSWNESFNKKEHTYWRVGWSGFDIFWQIWRGNTPPVFLRTQRVERMKNLLGFLKVTLLREFKKFTTKTECVGVFFLKIPMIASDDIFKHIKFN